MAKILDEYWYIMISQRHRDPGFPVISYATHSSPVPPGIALPRLNDRCDLGVHRHDI